MLYIAIGILGATVMPHNLYLHSSIVQTRRFGRDEPGKRDAIRHATIDSNVALTLALFINAAILILAAATFHVAGRTDVAEIGEAYHLLAPMLGHDAQTTTRALSAMVGRQLPFFSMVNLIAERKVVPELMQDDMTGERLAAETLRLLDNDEERAKMKQDLASVAMRLVSDGNVMSRAADEVARVLETAK